MLLLVAAGCGAEASPDQLIDAGRESPDPEPPDPARDAEMAGRGAGGEPAPPLDAGPRPIAADAEPADAAPEPREEEGGTKNPPQPPEPLPPLVSLELPIAGTCAFEPQPLPATSVDNPACPDGVFQGNLTLGEFADLTRLHDCSRLAGTLTVASPSLERLDGLESLRVIEGSLIIAGPTCSAGTCTDVNARLRSVRGLQSLRCVGGDLTVSQPAERSCAPLDLTALRKLVEVGGALSVDVCTNSNADHFDSLQRVWGDLTSRVRLTPARLQAVYGSVTTAVPSSFPSTLYVGCREGSTPCRDGLLGCSWQADKQAGVAPLALCEVALRDLKLIGTSITSLTPLSKLREVRGDLIIGPPPGVAPGAELSRLASLAGLEMLTHVRRLSIAHAPFITSLGPLANLASARAIRLENLDGLLDLTGLEHVTELSGSDPGDGVLRIAGNAALETLTGLALMAAHEVELDDDALLSSVAALWSLEGSLARLQLRSLPQLNSLDGLQQVGELRKLEIANCPGLLDLTELQLSSTAEMTIANLPSLSTLQGILLPDVTQLARLELSGLPSLQSLAGLENIQSMDLRVSDCDGLIDLTGLDAFAGGSLTLSDNALLRSLEGAPKVVTLELLTLERNAELRTLEGVPLLSSTGLRAIDLPVLENFAALGGVQLTSLELQQLPVPLDLTGLEGVSDDVTRVTIAGNAELADLTALANLRKVQVELEVSMNPRLLSLHGLEGLRSAPVIRISDNEALEEVRALGGLDEASLSIARNASLPECEIDWLRERLAISILAADNGPPGSCSP